LPLLEQLSLGNNRISILPALTFKNNRKLLTLWLNHNKITKIDQILMENLTSLETVGFSENPLESIDLKIFEFNKNIRNIYFYKCAIRMIKNIRKISTLKKLQTANFQENICINREYTTTCVIELRQDLLRTCEFW
jgi:Leucine-rich repeat (LRR) protein